jgi:hypothetical protein
LIFDRSDSSFHHHGAATDLRDAHKRLATLANCHRAIANVVRIQIAAVNEIEVTKTLNQRMQSETLLGAQMKMAYQKPIFRAADPVVLAESQDPV